VLKNNIELYIVKESGRIHLLLRIRVSWGKITMILVEEKANDAKDEELRKRSETSVDMLVTLLTPVGNPEVVQRDKVPFKPRTVPTMEKIREMIRSQGRIMQVVGTLYMPVNLVNV